MESNKIAKNKAEAEAMDYSEIYPPEPACKNTLTCHIIIGFGIAFLIVSVFTTIIYFS